VVVPKPARFGTLDESGATWEIDSRQPGAIVARVLHRQSDAGAAIAIYRLDDDLVPTEADTSDNYQAVYESQVRNLAIPPHVPAAVDPEREFLPILHWINGKFVPVGKRAP
jgi:hypothetical protein